MNALALRVAVVGALFASIFVAGCEGGAASSENASPAPAASTPAAGTTPNATLSENGACKSDADCGKAETCGAAGLCEIIRCAATGYSSSSPLGSRANIGPSRLPVLATSSTVAGFDVNAGHAVTGAVGKYTATKSDGALLDTAGGDFFGARPEAMAFITSGAESVGVMQSGTVSRLALDFAPIAIAAGDTDADGADEVIAVGASGQVALCRAAKQSCARASVALPSGTYVDVAAVDADGDGAADPVFLSTDGNGASVVTVWEKGALITSTLGSKLFRIGAGYTDAGQPIVTGLEDGGYLGYGADVVHVLTVTGTVTDTGTAKTDDDTQDVTIDDVDGDGKQEIIVLTGSSIMHVLGTDLTAKSDVTVDAVSGLSRIAYADLGGSSAIATLTGAPTVVAGNIVPTAVLVYPPYPSGHTNGSSEITVGDSTSTSTTYTDSIGVRASLGIGFEAEVPDVAKVSIMPRVEVRVDRAKATTHTVTIADRYTIDASPALAGPDEAAVMLANGCYHAYTYTIDDPQKTLSADQAKMVLFVPLPGQTTLWSLSRYNAWVLATGQGTAIHVPYQTRDMSTYPSAPVTLGGAEIPDADLVLSTTHDYRASDVARVGFQLDVMDATTSTTTSTISASAVTTVKVGALVVTGEVGGVLATSYAVALGSDIALGGSIPPVNQGELDAEGYSFSPLVYREHTADGGGYYVLSYVVGK